MVKKGIIFIISGPSGSGKTTLYRKLLTSGKLKNKLIKAISVTTRPRREGETHGKDYYFVSKKKFLYMKRSGRFLESEKVFESLYGTPKKAVFDLIKAGKCVLLCIDVKGAKTIRRKIKNAIAIFIKTRSLGELKKRLTKRGSEDKSRLRLRLRTAQKELKEAVFYDYIVVNNKIQTSLCRLEKIILSEIQKSHN